MGNFGFLVDNDTQEILDSAPVFDYNMSLLCRAMDADLKNGPWQYERENGLGHKLGGDFLPVGRSMMTDKLAKALSGLSDFKFIPHEKYDLPSARLDLLNKLVQRQIKELLQI